MTLSPARTFRAALWRVSSADAVQTSVPNCKTGLAGDSLFHANGANNGRMRQRDRAFDGGAWSTRAVRGRRARMNRGTERSGKPRGSIEAHTFACCPPEHFLSAWWNVNTHKAASVLEITLVKQRSTQAEMFVWMSRIRRVPGASIEGSNPSALTTFAVSGVEGHADAGLMLSLFHLAPSSRYQARPDCNPLPSRSSRHSVVTTHPRVPTIHLHTHP